MSIIDHRWFSGIRRPSRYLGDEVNSIRKDLWKTEVSIALAFPDVYEVGMSHFGLKILYHYLNRYPWLAAERVFSPWVDLEKELRNHEIPLTTLESGRPLSDFDIVGFSLQHELSFTNVINMLDLSGLTFLAAERRDHHPIVIAGGPAVLNPEPMAEFFDAMVIGDGEEVTLKICQIVRQRLGQRTKDRKELLSQLSTIKGVYVPANFRIHYLGEGPVEAIEPLVPNDSAIERAIIPRIDDYPFPDSQVVPYTELVHDRLALEISRGCTRGCRFCQAGMIYRPVRERSPGSIFKNAEDGLRLTGYEDLSLLSLSSGDYSCLEPLLVSLMDRHSPQNVALSLPSLRVDSMKPALMQQIKRVRKTGFTLAPEAGSERLRKIINKGLSQEDIIEMATAVYGAGWKLIKLYFMVGLPYERTQDLQEIIDLAKAVTRCAGKKSKRPKLNVSISTFVPKSHTPFMWSHQIPLEESQRRIQMIQNGLKGSPVRVKWNDPELSWLEGIFSRGDRRLGKAIVEAWKLGAKFDAWGEHFHREPWEEAFRRTGINPQFYLCRGRSLDEVLPWDHIKSGVTKSYLQREWIRAQTGTPTPDCRDGCLDCGVCDHKEVGPVLFENWEFPRCATPPASKTVSSPPRKFRIDFEKRDQAKYLGHLELVRVFVRAFRRAGFELVYSRGYHPMPKLSFACALPVGTESLHETLEVELRGTLTPSDIIDGANHQLPRGIQVNSAEEIAPGKKKGRLRESHFVLTVKGVDLREKEVKRFLQTDHFPVLKTNKNGGVEVNARSLVKSMRLISSKSVELVFQHTTGPELKPVEILKSVFDLQDAPFEGLSVLKIKQVFS